MHYIILYSYILKQDIEEKRILSRRFSDYSERASKAVLIINGINIDA